VGRNYSVIPVWLQFLLLADWKCERREPTREILLMPEGRLRQDDADIIQRLAKRRSRPGYAAPAFPN